MRLSQGLGSAALHQFSYSERWTMFTEAGDTMSSLFCWWSLCCFPKGIYPPTHPPVHPAIHPSIQLSNHPPTHLLSRH